MSDKAIPEHLQRPHLRPIQPIPVQKDGQRYLALRDPQQLQPQTIVVPPNTLPVLQEFRGEKTLEQIADQFQTDAGQIATLVNGLDQLGLLWGPTFERMEADALGRILEEGAFPCGASMALGQDEAAAREALKGYFDDTEDPELDIASRAIVAPHLDYERGWPNYAAAYYSINRGPAPDRVVILGTNHYGIGDGVVFTECGFQSPLGRCPADTAVVEDVVRELGRPIVADQLDFMAEHSVELHLPWIQYCHGNIPVVAALIPDPLHEMLDDEDSPRIDTADFVEVLRKALQRVGGETLFIASADLSHVGPQFGEPRVVDDQRRFDVERHDRDMMGKYLDGDADEFLDAMSWNRNPTRWCSIGNMAATLQLAAPDAIDLIDYRQAIDDKGHCLVSSAAMSMA